MKHLYRIAELPEPARVWLGETRPQSVVCFPLRPSPGLALGVTLIASIPVIVFVASATTAVEDLAAGAVAILIFGAVVAWWLRERSRARAIAQGRHGLGMCVGETGVMWRYRHGEAWFFARPEIASIEVDVHRTGRTRGAGNFVVHTRDGEAYAVGRADGFVLSDVWGALKAYGVTFSADPVLKIGPPSAPPADRTNRWEPTPFPGSAERHFCGLCREAGIGLVEIQEGTTRGSSAGSIDTPSITRMERPLEVRLSELLRLYNELIPGDQDWLDRERIAAGDTDPMITVEQIGFGLSDYQTANSPRAKSGEWS